MATVTVRVVPRSSRRAVEAGPDGIVVRVQAPPEGGRATEEARRALAHALAVRPGRVRLRTGARARTKTFVVEGLTEKEVSSRLSTS